jgi:putative transposase
MARSLRIEYPGAWYHVTCRGNERRAIFADDEDRLRFLDILEGSSTTSRVEVHVYVLMDNRFHLVVMTHEANLHRFMQRFNTAYTVYFNRRHARVGHLYQGRYKALLVDADSYLLELSRYVHLNPVRTNKYSVLDAAGQMKVLNNYQWSSFQGYTIPGKQAPFLNTCKILEMIGGADVRERRSRYAQFVRSGIGKEQHGSILNEVQGQTILGSDGFVDWVRRHLLAERGDDPREVPALRCLRRKEPIGMQEIARRVASNFEIKEADLYQPYAVCREARSIFLALCCRFLSHSMSLVEIAQALGNVSAAALSQNRKRLETRMKQQE